MKKTRKYITSIDKQDEELRMRKYLADVGVYKTLAELDEILVKERNLLLTQPYRLQKQIL